MTSYFVTDVRPVLARRDRRDLAVPSHLVDRRTERVDLVERLQLLGVAEQHVHLVSHEGGEVAPVPIDAERVGQRQRHLAPVGVSHPGSATERLLCIVTVEQVALHVEHRARGDRLLVEVIGAQVLGDAEVGAHRALGVRRHDDDAPSRRRVVERGAGPERDPDRVEIVGEHLTQAVVGDLAQVRRPATEAGQATHRVGRRTAAHLDRRSERLVQVPSAIDVDQSHRTLDQPMVAEELLVGVGDHVDQRIADADDVVASVGRGALGHGPPRYRPP